MNYRRLHRALVLIRADEPCFDDGAYDWLRSHCLVSTELERAMPADVLTVAGMNLLNMTELYFAQMLKRLHETGQLRRPDHDQK